MAPAARCYLPCKGTKFLANHNCLHEMEPLLGKSVTKAAGKKSLHIGFTKYGNSHLFSDTFGRSSILSKDDLKDLGDVLNAASYINDSPLTHTRMDSIEHFYYFKAQVRGKG